VPANTAAAAAAVATPPPTARRVLAYDRAMDPTVAERARYWAREYAALVARFDLCPWAGATLAKDELWVAACDEADVEDALARFADAPTAVIGLCVLPGFAGDLNALRRLRGRLNAAPIGRTLALAEFHPDAPLDQADGQRLIPYLRRTPDPTIQAVRHATLASVRKNPAIMDPATQAAVLAGKAVPPVRDIGDRITDANFARMQADGAALAAALDALITARRADPAAHPPPPR
jgi:hypothetical protein